MRVLIYIISILFLFLFVLIVAQPDEAGAAVVNMVMIIWIQTCGWVSYLYNIFMSYLNSILNYNSNVFLAFGEDYQKAAHANSYTYHMYYYMHFIKC